MIQKNEQIQPGNQFNSYGNGPSLNGASYAPQGGYAQRNFVSFDQQQRANPGYNNFVQGSQPTGPNGFNQAPPQMTPENKLLEDFKEFEQFMQMKESLKASQQSQQPQSFGNFNNGAFPSQQYSQQNFGFLQNSPANNMNSPQQMNRQNPGFVQNSFNGPQQQPISNQMNQGFGSLNEKLRMMSMRNP